MQDKPTSHGRLQLASGGPKQLHLTKPELGRPSDSRKTDWLALSHSFCPPSLKAPPSTPPHQTHQWSRPLALASRPYVPRGGGRRSWRGGGVAVPAKARAGGPT